MSEPKSISINERKSKVTIEDIAPRPDALPLSFLDRFPDILAGRDLKEIVRSITYAWSHRKPVILTFGAHVIKCGLSNIICDLIRNSMVDCIATNGASIVHDVELALFGRTSEEVNEGLISGGFGNTEETIEFITNTVNNLIPRDPRLGVAIGNSINMSPAPHKSASIFATAYRYNCPSSVHLALGTDIFNMHDACSAELLGKASMCDFYSLVPRIADLGGGGVLLNFGSAVVMPEVILKAIAMNRMKGIDFKGCVMADFDMNRQYRSMTRIVETAKVLGGKGYHLTIQHEIILPILGGLLRGAV